MTKRLGFIATVCFVLMGVTVSYADKGHGHDPMPLKAPAGSKAETHIAEGIMHYEKGHMDEAKKHFTAAAQADPQSAEAHYDVALVLDKTGDHKSAIEHFKKAQELGKDNPDIQNSEILKEHLKH